MIDFIKLHFSPMRNIRVLHAVSIIVRLVMLCYGTFQDQSQLKYTDIDYHVFTDAARFVTQRESPYSRSTYRYTPLLAWLLAPNVFLSPHFGKLLFVISDVLSGSLLYRILTLRGVRSDAACRYCALWLLNPLPIGVSTRGNAEALLSLLVLSTLLCLYSNRVFMAALLYGLSVHMKIYPVTYALPIALFLSSPRDRKNRTRGVLQTLQSLFNKDLFLFVAVAGSVLFTLTLLFYYMYGWDFLYQTYLYHLTRRDIRHNFSPYFYMLYLTAGTQQSWILGLLAFLPQAAILFLTSLFFYPDLPLCCFLNTAIFVSFNKVCTSQYFLWYLCLLPLVLPYLRMSLRRMILLLLLWFIGQGLWLAPAYYLEFEGHNTFLLICAAGLLFLIINTFVIVQIIVFYVPAHQTKKKR